MAHEGHRLVGVCIAVCFWLLSDPACDKCFWSHRLRMCASSWPGSTMKIHCLLLIALNCSNDAEVKSPLGWKFMSERFICAMVIGAKWFIWLKPFVKNEQHSCRRMLSCKCRALLLKCKAESQGVLQLQPLSKLSLLMLYFWIHEVFLQWWIFYIIYITWIFQRCINLRNQILVHN